MVEATSSYDDYVRDVLAKGPRCGCLDTANLGESKWGLGTVSWGVASFPGGIEQSRVLDIYEAAFRSWSNVCKLKFQFASNANQANIVIGTGRGARSNFDGKNGTLAWAYLPSGSNFKGQLQVRFDLDETWVDNPQARGILLLNVAAHEFGHAIGLSHNNVAKQLLNPYYNSAIDKPQSYDIQQIQSLYGKPVVEPTPTPDPTDPSKPASDIVRAKYLLRDGRVLGADKFVEIPATALTGPEWSF